MRKMATIPEIRNEIMDNSKLVYFAAGEQTTISWKEVPCDIVDVASKPYFKVIKSQEIVTLPSIRSRFGSLSKMSDDFLTSSSATSLSSLPCSKR